jgi:hypothetical protein
VLLVMIVYNCHNSGIFDLVNMVYHSFDIDEIDSVTMDDNFSDMMSIYLTMIVFG